MIIKVIFSYVYDEKFIYQLLATLSVYLSLNVLHFYWQRHKRYQLFKYYNIPGPKPNLFDGNFNYVRTTTKELKIGEELRDKYGKIYHYFCGDFPSVTITDHEILRVIFFEKMSSFTERTHKPCPKLPLMKGIFFAHYNKWKFIRKSITPSFSGYSVRNDSATQFIENSIKLMLEYIEQRHFKAKANGGNLATLIDIHELMKATSLHLISAIALKLPNIQVKEGDARVKSLDAYMSKFDQFFFRLVVIFPIVRYMFEYFCKFFESMTTLGAINYDLDSVIKESLRSKSIGHERTQLQVIDILARLYYRGKLSKDELQGTVESLLVAGYDTTSTTLTYLFWVLAKYPDIQDKLRTELLAHGIESKYLEQVLNETMRLYPTVVTFTTRLSTRNCVINEDLTIPQGVEVIYHAWLMHRDPSLWANPLKFDPEHFREGVEIHSCAFAPFGLGERKCLGYQLALMEMKMMTCDLLIRYNFKLISPQNLELVTYAVNLTKPKDKIVLEWTKR